MCSPGGNATINSLMNVATFLLEITSHSHSFISSTESSTTIFMSSFTFTWQPKRQWACCSLRLKCTISVGNMLPPPVVTRTLHCPQLPFPPQAEGRCTPLLDSVARSDEPVSTSISFLSLIFMRILPEGTR